MDIDVTGNGTGPSTNCLAGANDELACKDTGRGEKCEPHVSDSNSNDTSWLKVSCIGGTEALIVVDANNEGLDCIGIPVDDRGDTEPPSVLQFEQPANADMVNFDSVDTV